MATLLVGSPCAGERVAELAAAKCHRARYLSLPPVADPMRVEAYRIAGRAGWWWPHADFVVISEHPVEQHLDFLRPPKPRRRTRAALG